MCDSHFQCEPVLTNKQVHRLENLDLTLNLTIGQGVNKVLLHSNIEIISQLYVTYYVIYIEKLSI